MRVTRAFVAICSDNYSLISVFAESGKCLCFSRVCSDYEWYSNNVSAFKWWKLSVSQRLCISHSHIILLSIFFSVPLFIVYFTAHKAIGNYENNQWNVTTNQHNCGQWRTQRMEIKTDDMVPNWPGDEKAGVSMQPRRGCVTLHLGL